MSCKCKRCGKPMETSLGEEDIKNYFYKIQVKLDQYYDKDKNYKDVPIGFVVMFWKTTFSKIYNSEWKAHMRSYFNKKRNIKELDEKTFIDEFHMPYTYKLQEALIEGHTDLIKDEAVRVYNYAVRTQDIDTDYAKEEIYEFFESRFPTQKKLLQDIKNTLQY